MTIGTATHKRSKLLKIGGQKGNGPGIDLPSGNPGPGACRLALSAYSRKPQDPSISHSIG